MITPVCNVSYYRHEGSVDSMWRADDSIFISARGTYISRDSIGSVPAEEIVPILDDLNVSLSNDISPFIVFSQPFDRDTQSDVEIPREMIHIDSHGWVTHFVLGDEPTLDVSSEEIEHPHHIEMSSPESRNQFVDKVSLILKNIEAGEITKAVLARKLNVTADIPIDPRLVVRELIDSQPSTYVYSHNGFVGASPELLVEKFSGSIRCLPMAGTRRRHARISDDDADIADLQTNTKDLTEHRVVIDDIVSKLSLIAHDVSASDVPHVVRLPHVSHLATSVTAYSNDTTTLMDLVTALHPTPAVGGTPTDKALKIISEVEGFNRGIYGAPIGWIDAHGNGQCAIALRCAHIEGTKAQLFAGVGIVEGSDPVAEWNETQAKFGVMRDALMNISQ